MNQQLFHQIQKKRLSANRLFSKGQFKEAIHLLQKSHTQYSQYPIFLTDLASAYAKNFDFEDAQRCIKDLLNSYRNDTNVVCFVGDLYSSMRYYDQSIEVFSRLTKMGKSKTEGHFRIATLLERQGRIDEASEYVEKALKQQANSEEGRFLQAQLQVRLKQFEKAGESLFALLSSGLTNREIHWKAGHLLASVLDKQKNYADAAQVLVAIKQGMENDFAKEIKIARNAFAVKNKSIQKLTASITASDVRRWRKENEIEPLPVTLLVGHPRSGTTLLETILERHDGLASAEETTAMEDQIFRAIYGIPEAKTQLFNLSYLDQISVKKRQAASELYFKALQQFLPSDSQHSCILDKNPMLTHFMTITQRFFPFMQSVVALRDPRAVCLSCFQQSVGVNTSNVAWLRMEDTVNAYNAIMGVWLKLREILPDGWLEIRYEDLVKNTRDESRRVLDFLNLSWKDDLLEKQSPKKTIFSPTYAEAAQPVYTSSLQKWKEYEEILAPHSARLNPAIKAFGYD